MKKTSKSLMQLKTLFIGVSAALLVGCDAVVDCIDNDGPVFETSDLPPAVLNQVYTGSIVAAIQNEPLDDRFDYDFTLFNGSLPAGITAAATGRKFVLSGTPTELGSFPISLSVEVDDGFSAEESGLCYRVEDRDFVLVVEQEGG